MQFKSLKRQFWFLVVLTILLCGVLAQKSFASCTSVNQVFNRDVQSFSNWSNYYCDGTGYVCVKSNPKEGCYTCDDTPFCEPYDVHYWSYTKKYYTNCSISSSQSGCSVSGHISYIGSITNICTIACTSESEADSVYCALNPTADGCVKCDTITETDCKNEYIVTWTSTGIGSSNGYWAAVEIRRTYRRCTDGTEELLSEQQGSELPNVDCRENPFGSDSSQSSDVRCVGAIGNTCIFESGIGETFTCSCDGSCDDALRPGSDCAHKRDSVFAGRSSASSSGSSASSSESSASSSESSASSSASSSPSSSGSEGGDEHDYSGVLEQIRQNTATTAGYSGQNNRELKTVNGNLNQIITQQETMNGNMNTVIRYWDEYSNWRDQLTDGLTDTASLDDAPLEWTDTLPDPFPDPEDSLDSPEWDSAGSFLDSMRGNFDSLKVRADSTLAWTDSIAAAARDTTRDTVDVDSLWTDPDKIKKDAAFSGLFFGSQSGCADCYKISFTVPLPSFVKETHTLSVDLGSIGEQNWNFCAFIKKIVSVFTLVIVLLMNIKTFKSAFAQGDGN